MASNKTKVDLDYITPNSSFIYPLYSDKGDKVLESRTVLTSKMINNIKIKYGHFLYFTDTGEKAVIPHYRMKIAYNNAKDILNEIEKTDKLSKAGYHEAEKVVDEILNDLYKVDVESIKLLKELDTFDEYLFNHLVNVGVMSAIFANKLGNFTPEELKGLTLGGYLIDIGQKKIDKQLLNKEGKLDVSEFQKLKRHPQLGYEIIKKIDQSNPIILQSILFHHEKVNNKGYYQLPYEHLPIYPKIISVCDIFDALTTERPFRKYAISPSDALKAILNSTNSHFDYSLISQFINLMGPLLNNAQAFYKQEDICELDSSELALIINHNNDDLMKPEVLVFCKFDRQKTQIVVDYYKNPQLVDLKTDRRKLRKILSNSNQIDAIKKTLTEKKIINN